MLCLRAAPRGISQRPGRRLAMCASTLSASQPQAPSQGLPLAKLPKSWRFTSALPPDPLFPTPAASHQTPRHTIVPRLVRNAIFTWVRPVQQTDPQLLAVSPAALCALGIEPGEVETDDFRQFVAGNKLYGWDEDKLQGGYPWAQCYGGFQFGEWAGQLGDGRVISLFETTNPASGTRLELQLKGAGMTPYSRFADGKAVLRSSIREFLVSEALHALGIPTTRALSLTLLPHSKVQRERIEPAAIVLRFAQSWLRLGSFDLLWARGDGALLRTLATYVAEDVFGGWETLPGRLDDPDKASDSSLLRRGIGRDAVEGPTEASENRFTRLYRETVRRNAATVAAWQAYGFMNGVLNTDNTSIYGLSMDFGPFAFMDNFDPTYTPNHDDHLLRYNYENQPAIVWWNLMQLGRTLAGLMGAGADVDDEKIIAGKMDQAQEEKSAAMAEAIIARVQKEYFTTFLAEYNRLMTARLGLRQFRAADDGLIRSALETMEAFKLDYNHFFRRLSAIKLLDIASPADRYNVAAIFSHHERGSNVDDSQARQAIASWLERWHVRVQEDWKGDDGIVDASRDGERIQAMKRVNPNFVLRSWILDEVIRRVEQGGERRILDRVMHMSLHPFEDKWDGESFDGVEWKGDSEEEKKWVGDVPRTKQAMQCSCSS